MYTGQFSSYHRYIDIYAYVSADKQQVRKAQQHRNRNVNQFTAQAEAREANLFHRIPDSWMPVRI